MDTKDFSTSNFLDDEMKCNLEGDEKAAQADKSDSGSGVDADTYIAAGKATMDTISALAKKRPKTDTETAVKAACGVKPKVGKGKKATYQKCAQKVIAQINQPRTVERAAPSSSKGGGKSNKGLIIGVSVLGVLLLGTIAFVVAKKMKAPVATV